MTSHLLQSTTFGHQTAQTPVQKHQSYHVERAFLKYTAASTDQLLSQVCQEHLKRVRSNMQTRQAGRAGSVRCSLSRVKEKVTVEEANPKITGNNAGLKAHMMNHKQRGEHTHLNAHREGEVNKTQVAANQDGADNQRDGNKGTKWNQDRHKRWE